MSELNEGVDTAGSNSDALCMGELSPDVSYWPLFLDANEASSLFHKLNAAIPWHQPRIFIYGRWVDSPRLAAWYGDAGKTYRYSGLENQPLPWIEELLSLRAKLESFCGVSFNSVLANLYRNGQDSMGWHSDDEPELGEKPVIASLSLGGTRRFLLKHRRHKSARAQEFSLEHGSLLLMHGGVQNEWRHSVPKTRRSVPPRINLTFRYVFDSHPLKRKRSD